MGVGPCGQQRASEIIIATAQHARQQCRFILISGIPAEQFYVSWTVCGDEIERKRAVAELLDGHIGVGTEPSPDRIVRQIRDHRRHVQVRARLAEEVELGRVCWHREDEVRVAIARVAVAEIMDGLIDGAGAATGFGLQRELAVLEENCGAVDVTLLGNVEVRILGDLRCCCVCRKRDERHGCGHDGCGHGAKQASMC